MLKRILTIAFLGLVFLAAAQELSLDSDKRSIAFGEPVISNLRVDIAASNKKADILLPDSLKPYVSGLEIISISSDTVVSENEQDFALSYLFEIKLTGFDSGTFNIGPFPVIHGTDTLWSESNILHVLPVQIDSTADIRDIKPNVEIPLGIGDYIKAYYPIPVSLGLLAVLGYFIWRWLRKRKNQVASVVDTPKVPELTAEEAALKALAALRDPKAVEQLGTKEYFAKISYITREYLGKRYQMNALEQTSSELCAALRYKLGPAGLIEDLQEVLNLVDLVKFAKEKPDAHFAKSALDKATAIVKATARKEDSDGQV